MLKFAIMLGGVVIVAALSGSILTRSKKLIEITVASIVLNVPWAAGLVIIRRNIKDIDHVHYRNLNGHNSFEMLMIYC